MDLWKIHDNIINRAKTRTYDSLKHQNHHIIPKHENENSEDIVPLTFKEHYIIHLIRYKLGFGLGNYKAYLLLRNWKNTEKYSEFLKEISQLGATSYHTKYKERDPEKYYESQKNAGIRGGQTSYIKQLGFFSLSEEQKSAGRKKGNETVVNNKLGMFSDEYREKHRKTLFKKISVGGIIYNSMKEVSEKYSICASSVTYRANSSSLTWINWFYVEKENCNE